MSNPLRQLKYLPWLSLFQIAALTVFFAFVLDVLLAIAAVEVDALGNAVAMLLSPPLGILIAVAIAAAIGALAVYLLERLQPRIAINAGILWALILCVILMLILKSLLPLPAFLVGIDQNGLMGIVLGVFWQGRRYWRRW